jgi:alkylmercury lyase-like protein
MRRVLISAQDSSVARQSAKILDARLREFIYHHFIRKGRAPTVAEMAAALSSPVRKVRAALDRLARTHAFVLQENGELWRAAPFSAVPTAFPVRTGKRSWYGNCIWDALGIPAMLHQDATIDASCACCNFGMVLSVKNGRLRQQPGLIHIAVPARHWYEDIVFT